MSDVYKSSEGERLIRARYLELLPRWPIPFERRELETREGTTSVVVCGDPASPPLVLFHGSMSNSLMWMGDSASWADHYRTFAVDLIGEPGLSAPSRPPIGSPAYALWLDDLFAQLGIDAPAIVGISLGGWLALDYAVRRPGAVSKLVVMCPAGVGRQRQSFYLKVFLYLMLGKWGRNRLRSQIIGGDANGASDQLNLYMDYLAMIQREFNPRIVKFPRLKEQALQSLTMPLLAILGGKDVFFDSGQIRQRLERNVPNARVIFHPRMGHMITGQTEVILDFLRNEN